MREIPYPLLPTGVGWVRVSTSLAASDRPAPAGLASLGGLLGNGLQPTSVGSVLLSFF